MLILMLSLCDDLVWAAGCVRRALRPACGHM